MHVDCKEVWIKFRDAGKQGQRIACSDYSGAERLTVTVNELFVVISYMNKENPIKILSFNRDAVHEFSMEDSVKVVQ